MKKNTPSSLYVLRAIFFFIAILCFYFPTSAHGATYTKDTNQYENYNNDETETFSGATSTQDVPVCSVISLTSSAPANTVTEWGTTTLSWTQSNCTTLTLSSSDETFSNTSVLGKSSVETSPIGQTTSYFLVGTDANGTVSQQALTVNVSSNVTPATQTCQLYSFDVNGSNYAQVSNQGYATLTWDASPGCSNISITGNNGAVFSNQANQASLNVGPFYSSVVYTINAYDSYGTNYNQQVTVSVDNSNNYNNYNNYGNNNNDTSTCVVTDFDGAPTSITSGQTTTLSWSTMGCSNVSITSAGVNIPNGYDLPANGSIQTNALYGTTDFILTANGNGSTTWPPLTIYVTGGSYSYTNTQNNSGSSAITSVATNVGPYSAKINGVLIGNPAYPTQAWFEYGVDTSVGSTTPQQTFSGGNTEAFNAVIYTNPSTTYYYRAVTQSNGVTSLGDIMTLITKPQDDTTVYTQNSDDTPTSNTTTVVPPTPAVGVTLSITNPSDKVNIGDTIDYTIAYANNTSRTIKNTILNLSLPQGFSIIQTTQGQTVSPTMMTASLGTIAPGQKGTVFLQAMVENTVSLTNTLVTNGTMSYTYSNGVSDSATGFVLNHASGVSSLGGFALGAGFFPTTILGWLVTILIILAVILTIRRISKAKNSSGGHDAHH